MKSKWLNGKTAPFWSSDSEPWNSTAGPGLAGGFVLGAETPRADVDFSLPSLYHNRSSLDIRQPLSQGMLFGMADTAPELDLFTANLTLHRDFSFYLDLRNDSTIINSGERAG